ncbi:MAG TPA: AAA domain-containing protein, partial [Lamprocystis sp. (in: g-proteobacteria)]|nr:AAA domain-containing protein [Lamprocystis sp. (in: g-proteobacteria)]
GTICQQVQPLVALQPALAAAGAWPEALVVPALDAWDGQVDERLKLLYLREHLGETAQQIAHVVPWIGDWPRAQTLGGLARAWQRDHARLVESDRLVARARGHLPKAGQLVRQLADRHDQGDWADLVRKGWALAGIAHLEAADGETLHLDRMTADEASRTGERLGQVLGNQAHLSVAELLARQDRHPLLTVPQPGKGQRRSTEQTARETLLKEAKKQRNILPLRSFVRRFDTEGLLDLLPVWLLSPQTMAVLFPRQALFDQVIIDEASQCTVENGFAVLLRGKRVVIAGDEHQMPPTNFFRAGEATDDDPDDDTERRDLREMFDAESLLVLARNRVPHVGLDWHYRCLHEELIAFSNHAIYGGTLKTIPSTASRTAPPALRWVHVPDSAYQDGANPVEAARVVDLIGELLQRPDRPTLGVVTFNLVQRRAILDEIDRRRAEDAVFGAAYDAAMARDQIDERPFVKNLESVQGDERDLILFSLGHAPLERIRRDGRTERYVPARFGPLGQRGGERRLNVAVSRAKREILVVASFDPVLLSVARSKHDGPKLFKQFLEYAYHLAQGRRNQAERVLAMARGAQAERHRSDAGRHPSGYIPLKVQLALALEQRGHRCELDVGTSEHRIPLAVLDPADDGRYRLGILCEEGEHAPHPLESHVHVPRVLGARAWRYLTVDGREWQRHRDGVLRRIAAALADHPDVHHATDPSQ